MRFLVPYVDMVNHSSNKNTKWYYSPDRNGFVLEAVSDIRRGGEVFDSYGVGLTNEALFL